MEQQKLSFEELITPVDTSVLNVLKAEEKPADKYKAPEISDTKVGWSGGKANDGLPIKLCGYDRWEAVSSFHKELRRGSTQKATYWLQVLLEGGMPAWYVANYLWWIHGEELSMKEVHGDFGIYLAVLNTHGKKADPYQLYYAVIRFCKAEKWWEDEASVEMRLFWAKNAEALKKDRKHLHDVPEYAYDSHTRVGKQRMKDGTADLRYSGTWMGMMWRAKAYAQFKTIDVEWDTVAWEEGELEHWQMMEKEVC